MTLKRKVFSIPSISGLHECTFGIICKVEDTFLKKAIFANLSDFLQTLLKQLWADFLEHESNPMEPTEDESNPHFRMTQQEIKWRSKFHEGILFFDMFVFFDDKSMQNECASLLVSLIFGKERSNLKLVNSAINESDKSDEMLKYIVIYLQKSGYQDKLRIWIDKQPSLDLVPNGFKKGGWLVSGGNRNGWWKEVTVESIEDEYRYLESKPVDL